MRLRIAIFVSLCLTIATLAASAKNKGMKYHPGDVVDEQYLKAHGHQTFFSIHSIPDTIFALMQGRSYKRDCTVARSSLSYILCLHRDDGGRSIVGEMVVNKSIAADIVEIFRRLYEAGYPIERMRLIDYWDADDERAMTANNSSSFNFRFISHTRKVSKHGMGMAIDINPLYNPYTKTLRGGKTIVEPAAGRPYLDRNRKFKYKITRGDLCYRLFRKYGFRWGGDWKTMKDYQHFEKP
ncbi:MAG: M15 family metallopeptidase [Prevotella sp.]|nr:M15 family metallopeptidase [Prevotella sp.]